MLHVEVDPDAGGAAGAAYDLTFHTGSRRAQAPLLPTVEGYEAVRGAYDGACAAEVAAQDCFDTGQDTQLRVETSTQGAVAWLVDIEPGGGYPLGLLPARCGAPTLFTHAQRTVNTCYRVRAIGEGGKVSDAQQLCTAPGPDAGDQTDAAVDSGIASSAADAAAEPAGAASMADAAIATTAPDSAASREDEAKPADSGCTLTSRADRRASALELGLALLGLSMFMRRVRTNRQAPGRS